MKQLLLALQYLPMVLQAVVAVEGAIRNAPGATKKAVVLGAIQAGAQAVGTTAPTDDLKVVGSLIDTVVGNLNAGGVFEKPRADAVTTK